MFHSSCEWQILVKMNRAEAIAGNSKEKLKDKNT